MNTNGNTSNSENSEKRSTKQRCFMAIRVVLIIICLFVCVFAGYKVVSSIVSAEKAEKVYGNIESELESLFEAHQTDSNKVVWTRRNSQTEEPEPKESDIPSDTTAEDSGIVDTYVTSDISDVTNESESVSEPTADTEPAESQTDGETEAITEPETETETQTKPEPETDAETKTETETMTEPGTETETQTKPEPETDAETKAETEAITEPGTETETQAKPEPVTETETQAKPEPDTETEKVTEAPTSNPDTSATSEPEISNSYIQNYILSLQTENPDVVGIIYINMTVDNERKVILYPVVLPEDNEYYLTHDVYGNTLREGTIFFDKATDPSIMNNKNLVVYGHNMFGGTMFHNLMYFKWKSVFISTEIKIYTADFIYVYEPFSVYNTTATGGYCQMSFSSDSEFVSFMYNVKRESLWDKNMTFYNDDRIITLSTCYGFSNPDGRMAVHGVLSRIEAYD